jgi:DNA-binding XRE family transcriptional regulator
MAIPESSRRGPKQSVRFDRVKLRHARRVVAELTQQALADKAGISIDSMRRAEREDGVSLETARAVGAGLDIPVEELLRLEDESTSNADIRLRAILGLQLPYPGWLGMTGFVSPREHDYMCLLLQDCRITNRSASQSLSLGITLQLRLHGEGEMSPLTLDAENRGPAGARLGDIGLLADAEKQLSQKGIKPPSYLQFPLDLRPGQTVVGQIGFLIHPFVTQRLSDPWEYIDLTSQMLIVRDYISNDTLSTSVPCEYPIVLPGESLR